MDQKLYKETFDEITLPQKTREHLADLPERSINMKRLPAKKSVIVLTAAVVLCLGLTCYAALVGIRTDSSAAPATLTHSYDMVQQAQEETGLTFNCPQNLDYDFSFQSLNINDDTDYDEDGNVAGTYKSVYVGYMDPDGYSIVYQISPMEEAGSRTAMEDAAKGSSGIKICTHASGDSVTLYYQTETYNSEDGSISEEESVIWSDGENFYSISGYNMDLTVDQWFALAEDLL